MVDKKYKPKFSAEDFLRGLEWFKKSTAQDFLYFVKKRIEEKKYDFDIVEEVITKQKPITNEELSNSIVAEDGLVFTKEGNFVDKVTYAELIQVFEFGRKDKGVPPQPVLRICFEEYRPIYKQRFQQFLKGKLK